MPKVLEPLTARFYRRPTEVVARALLGKVLVHGARRARITECEAYLGPEDLASHARFQTERSKMMFMNGGVAYVFICYGVHMMFNVVTERDGVAGAVLIRSVAMLGPDAADSRATNGPGKLTSVLGLDLSHNGANLTANDDLYVSAGRGARRVKDSEITVGPRIGVDYAGEWAAAPLRYLTAQ